jgi:preprotein translocase subunit YajC
MLELISTAHAADAATSIAGPQGGGMMEIAILLFFFAIFYLLIWRPQAKRAKEHRALVSGLGKGDEVVMSGGMLGKIVELDDQYLTVKVAEGVQVKYQRHAVAQVLPKGTLKA